MFIRTESFQQFIRSYPIVTTILALQIGLWLIFAIPIPLIQLGHDHLVGFNYGVAAGEWWRLVTPIFLHGSLTHILFNSMSLFLFAPALEYLLGKVRFLIIYLGAGFVGNLGTYWVEPLEYVHVGASGAIFGLFGVYLYLVLFKPYMMDRGNSQVIITILAVSVIMTFVNSNINIMAHLFGLIGGMLLAPLTLFFHSKKRRY
ncbi:rhomboid family intramembrane serine protease [Bacillus pumilus]|uniref:rhomboid family intramembrane serine protease n=1 Tax=Bacillus pumilus TaxID=1408 RepID=UPI001657B713|nr:rhomboid family intramembrane serine protease [Bacillus pumilus]QNP16886.1 rhomboid family intramembrane serine protease [Bacillus pumilus]